MKLHHLAIQVHDIDRAVAFYAGVLGLVETRRQPHSVWLDADGVILMLERASGDVVDRPWTSDAPGLHLVALTIEASQRAAWRERLAAAGHPVVAETKFTLYVRDPEGNRIAFSHYPHPVPQRP